MSAQRDSNIVEFTADRTPPQSVELEQAVLGAIMLEPQAAFPLAIEQGLSSDSFYLKGHAIRFELMADLHRRGVPPDTEALLDELRTRGQLDKAGGIATVMGLPNSVISAAGIEGHARKIVDKASLRRLIRSCTEIIDECYRQELSCDEIHQRASSSLNDRIDSVLAHGNSALDVELFADSVDAEVDRLIGLYNASADPDTGRLPEMMAGVPTGFPRLDAMCDGYQPGDFNLWAAESNRGKTKITAYSLAAGAKEGHKVAWINLEMTKPKALEYIVTAVHNLSCERGQMIDKTHLYNLRSWGAMERAALEQARTVDRDRNIYWVPETSNKSLAAVCRRIRMLARDYGVKVVFIDQLQEIDEWAKAIDTNRGLLLTIARDIRRAGLENGVAVNLIHQLKRPPMRRTRYEIPSSNDLKESGALYELASKVFLIGDPQRWYYEEYGGYVDDGHGNYSAPPAKAPEDDSVFVHHSMASTRVIDLVLAKNRGDSTDIMSYKFDYKYGVKG